MVQQNDVRVYDKLERLCSGQFSLVLFYRAENKHNQGEVSSPLIVFGHGLIYEAKLSGAISMMERSSLFIDFIVPSISGRTCLIKNRAVLIFPS